MLRQVATRSVNAVNTHVICIPICPVFANTARNLNVERRRYLSAPIAKPLVNSSPDCPRVENGHSQSDDSHYSLSQRVKQLERDLVWTKLEVDLLIKSKLETSEKEKYASKRSDSFDERLTEMFKRFDRTVMAISIITAVFVIGAAVGNRISAMNKSSGSATTSAAKTYADD